MVGFNNVAATNSVSEFIEKIGLANVVEAYYTKWISSGKLNVHKELELGYYGLPKQEWLMMSPTWNTLVWDTAKKLIRHVNHTIYDEVDYDIQRQVYIPSWLVAHGLLIPELELEMSQIIDMIPIGKAEYVAAWNVSLLKYQDVPEVIRYMITLDQNGIPKIMSENPIDIVERFAIKDIPSEDNLKSSMSSLLINLVEKDPDVIDKLLKVASIAKESPKAETPKPVVEEKKSEEPKVEKVEGEIVYTPVISTPVAETVVVAKSDEPKAETPKPVVEEKKSEEVKTEAKAKKADTPVVVETKKDDKKEEYMPIPEHPSLDTKWAENNVYWEKNIAGLNKLTNIVRKAGLNVAYSEAPAPYDKLICASIIEGDNNEATRFVYLDPGVIYGDTLRLIPLTRKDDPKFDIKSEMYIPLSDVDRITKAISGTLTKKDREEFFKSKNVPRVLSDKRRPYHFLDRIDMSGLSNGRRVPFKQWESFVIKLSDTFSAKDPSGNYIVPDTVRFKIADFKDASHFTLVADSNPSIAYPSNIVNEPMHANAAASGLTIEYDRHKYANFATPFAMQSKSNVAVA